jgi:glycosyltransferase involved in cell wall biosynthesis
MKILHLYKDYYPIVGGIENHIRILAEAQAAAGHEATVLVCSPGRRTEQQQMAGVSVIKAGRLATAASMPLSLSQPWLLSRARPDIVHVHSPYPLGEVANYVLGRGRRTVISHHSDVVRQRGWLRLYGPLLRRVLSRADAIITATPPYLESSPWLQPVRQKCVIVPYGIDTRYFSPTPKEPRAAPQLLFVGRLRYYKGLDTLLQALLGAPEAQLTVVGEGPMEAEWRHLSRSLGLDGRVRFVGSPADDVLRDCYRQADLFVFPSNARSEAFGIALLEAMACGLPCITTELGTGTSWVVQDGVTGLVAPPRDPAALAEAIKKALADPARLQQMAAAALRRAREEFSQEKMAAAVVQLYHHLLGKENA